MMHYASHWWTSCIPSFPAHLSYSLFLSLFVAFHCLSYFFHPLCTMTAKQFFMLHVVSPNVRIFEISTISLFVFFSHLCCVKHVDCCSRHINSMLDFCNQIRIELIINTLFCNPRTSSFRLFSQSSFRLFCISHMC